MEFWIYRSQFEPLPTEENVRSFERYLADRVMKMFKVKLRVRILYFRASGASRKIELSHCDLTGDLWVRSFEDVFMFISLLIDHGSISDFQVKLEFSPTTFSYVKLFGVNMSNGIFKNDDRASLNNLIVNLENSTWVNKDYAFMELLEVLSISIVSSELTRTCSACNLFTIHGHDEFFVPDTTNYFLKSILENCHHPRDPIFSLINNIFRAEGSLQNKITTSHIEIILTNNTFIIEGSMSFNVGLHFEIINLLIQCSAGKMAQRNLGQSDVIYTCYPVCEQQSKYSLESGRLIMSGGLTNYEGEDGLMLGIQESGTIEETNVPSCQSCPLGAKCENGIQVLPNYWGYLTSKPSVAMIRCPDGYCCQDNETCKGIDSCNTGRTGTLCGFCEENLTESIFTPTCILKESCKSGFVTTLFISAALFYALFLLSFSTIKNKIIDALKKGYTMCKKRCKCDKDKSKDCNKQTVTEEGKTDDSGFKYMQILFYYVQDSKLFTIYLPALDAKTENVVVKFLEFSPMLLGAYIEATDLCLVGSSAIIKVVFELLFRFLVMMFLGCIYLIQEFLSQYITRKAFMLKLKVKLVEAFLLTVLVSYKKLLIGTFTLVQCVEIKDSSVLFIKANIECYTWWQIAILIYICICVVPLIFVLSHLPFCMKVMNISVRTFILSCIFPLPIIIWYLVMQSRRRCKSRGSDKDKGENMDILSDNKNTAETDNIPLRDVHIKAENTDITESQNIKTGPLITDKTKKGSFSKQEVPGVEAQERLVTKVEAAKSQSPDIGEGTVTEHLISSSSGKELHIAEEGKKQLVESYTEKLPEIKDDVLVDASVMNESSLNQVFKSAITECREEINMVEDYVEAMENEKVSCKKAIEDSLRKHHKCLNFFGIRFTWLGVHMLYRLALVACRTFITEPVTRLYPMGALVLVMAVANAFIKPYKYQKANITATLSYVANLCIAGLNLVKAHLVAFGCDTNCQFRDTVVQYMDTFENVLLLYAPIAAIGLWILYTVVKLILPKGE